MKRRRAGLSEVIAAMLILVIAVTIGTIFFAYGSTALSLTQSGFVQQTALSRDKLEERLVITHVFHNSSSPDISVFIGVFNYGMRSVTISTVFLNTSNVYEGSELSVWNVDRTSVLSGGRVLVGELAWIKVSDDLDAGVYRIIVVSERGNGFEARHEI
ncbi:MAG: hypothetical protein ACE5KH_04060 [Candidatus Geothermarchaeales archaeon]